MSDPRGELHPAVKLLFESFAAQRDARVLAPEAMRANTEALNAALNPAPPAVAVDREIRIPGPAGELRARVFAPRPPDQGPLPIVVYFHGGGFVVWSPETCETLTRRIALTADALVVSLEYRLAPEHPYPAPLDDCVAAVGWLRDNAAALGGDPQRIALAGDSAGGNLVAATTLRLLHEGSHAPAAALMIVPWTDLGLDTESFQRLGPDDPILDTDIMQFFRDCYAPRREQWDDPFISPLRADLAGFVPTCVIVVDIDPLCDDGRLFVEKLRKAGGTATLHAFAGMPHEFQLFLPIEETDRAVAEMCGFLSSALK